MFFGLQVVCVKILHFSSRAFYLAADPMSIINQTASEEEKMEAARQFGAAGLFSAVKDAVIVLAVISILCSLIGMLFVGKAEIIAEKKQDIMHKLKIVFLTASFISILNMVMYFIEGIVG